MNHLQSTKIANSTALQSNFPRGDLLGKVLKEAESKIPFKLIFNLLNKIMKFAVR